MLAGSETARQDVMKDNIILSNHREVLDYRTNPKFSRAVDVTTEYVSGAIDFIAHTIYITAQLSIRAARGWRAMGSITLDASVQAKQFYDENELGDKLSETFATVKERVLSSSSDRTIAAIEADLSELEVEAENYLSEARDTSEEMAVSSNT